MPTRKPRKSSRPPAEERTSGGDSLNAYIREISKFKPLPMEEERALGIRIQQGDQEALQRMVEANLRFVVSYAKRYRGLGMSFLDLIHEGTLGLIEAAKRYDPERNVKFISYAVWWVRQSIFHALSEHTRVFRLPQKLSGMVSKLGAARSKLSIELERPPTMEELAQRTQMSKEEVENLLSVAGEDLSLSTAVGEEGNLELGDTIEQVSVPSVETELIRTSVEERIRSMVGELDDKERAVINMRFGLDGDEARTLQEIGEAMGLSRERIRQIESKAKAKLQRRLDEMNKDHRSRGLGSVLN